MAALLELTLTGHAEHEARHGGQVALHRLTQTWSETGATWNCAVDADPANRRPDRAGETAWEMDRPKALRPHVSKPSATARLAKRGRGTVRFDVTADVAADHRGPDDACRQRALGVRQACGQARTAGVLTEAEHRLVAGNGVYLRERLGQAPGHRD